MILRNRGEEGDVSWRPMVTPAIGEADQILLVNSQGSVDSTDTYQQLENSGHRILSRSFCCRLRIAIAIGAGGHLCCIL